MDVPRRRVSKHIRNETALADWQRETLLLRIGVLCRSEYDWAAHVRVARNVGLDEAQIGRIVAGPSSQSDPVERALLSATSEIYRDDTISRRSTLTPSSQPVIAERWWESSPFAIRPNHRTARKSGGHSPDGPRNRGTRCARATAGTTQPD
jgi:hypothetical protein